MVYISANIHQENGTQQSSYSCQFLHRYTSHAVRWYTVFVRFRSAELDADGSLRFTLLHWV